MDAAHAAVAAAEGHLERGEPLMAYDSAQAGLLQSPGHTRLRQLQALALARSGDVERANALLAALAAEGVDDAETIGMLARTHKDLAATATEASGRDAHLRAAFDLYDRAYRASRDGPAADAAFYTGINAAAMATLRGDFERARTLAHEVREICERRAAGSANGAAAYWREATLAEAALILGDAAAARAHYGQAAALARGRYADLGTTRRQARLLASRVPGMAADVAGALAIPPILVFTGHMVDQPDRAAPRFPASIEPAVRESLRAALARIAPMAAYGSAACGTDILCLELARELGAETHVVLPFPPDEFRRSSIDFAAGDWAARFDAVLAAASSVTITSDHRARGSSATFEYANLVFTGMARLRAQVLDTPLRGLVVRDPAAENVPGGTTSIATLWEKHGVAVDSIDPAPLRGRSPAPRDRAGESGNPSVAAAQPTRHEIRAMLFADAVGYSQLSEDQIPGYISGFLGAVAELSRRTAHRFEHVETAGDGLYMVFRDAVAAGRFALELNALTRRFDRAAFGLPPTFNLRIALHCGPVHCGTDPITGLPIYTGPHTSRAARIEPITPPGQVYASSAFAAVSAATDGSLSMDYVGVMPLAKKYGSLGLYHVRPSPHQ